MFVSLYLVTKPTPENIIESIESEYSSPKDGKITTWLHRYIRGLSNEKLILFLRFVTASSTIQPKLIIQLRFVDQNPGCLRPISMTCFKILNLPRINTPLFLNCVKTWIIIFPKRTINNPSELIVLFFNLF